MASIERITDELEKPELDDRSYRVIRLSNKLEALLVHDPDTDKASASVNVNVGSMLDPEDMPGVAHAVEHVLFMGTEKFPVENDYNQYLSSHSGHSNAYTAATETNYFFEVAAQSQASKESSDSEITTTSNGSDSPFYGALDRFAQFFVAPLFDASTLDREMQAVDSENKKNLQSDDWRLNQLNKALANPKHPYSHFSTGNLETLSIEPQKRGVEIRDEFIKFYEKHYSANRMKVVVLGREPLDTLEAWVGELFSPVKNKDLPQNRWDDVELYTQDMILTQAFAKPVMEARSLDMFFPYQDEEELWEASPQRYISHLIGHEGPGSILSYIKAKGWANGLSAGGAPVCPGSAYFSISVRLTEEGLKNYGKIVEVIFQYISLIKETPPQEWVVDEMKGMSEVDFRFREKSRASSFTRKLSSVMQKPLPRDKLLSGYSLIRKFDPEGIRKGLSHLKPDNFRLTIVSQEYPGGWDQKEKWYGTEYKLDKIPHDMIQAFKTATDLKGSQRIPDLHFPHKNEFIPIPSRLVVDKKEVSKKLKAPKLIRNDEGVRTWWKKDDTFWVPKAYVFLHLRNPLICTSPATYIKSRFYCDLLRDSLEDYAYDAEIAGLEYAVMAHSSGIDVGVFGYNDKLLVLLQKVLTRLRDLEIKEERFEIMKERLSRFYRNFDYSQPYRQVTDHIRGLCSEAAWTTEQCGAEISALTSEDIRSFFPHILSQLHIEVFAHGNLRKDEALFLTDRAESILKSRVLPTSQWPISRSYILPPGSNFLYKRTLKDPANVNHCTDTCFYVGPSSDQVLRAKVELFAQLMEEPAFDQLRTKEQLGYIVFSHANVGRTTMAFQILIQSERSAEYLDRRIDALLFGFSTYLNDLKEEDFERYKHSLITRKLEKIKNLDQEFDRMWNAITNERFNFQQHEQDAETIKILTKADIIDFYKQYIDPRSETRAKLAVHMYAQTDSSDKSAYIIGAIEESLKLLGVTVKSAKFKTGFSSIDFSKPDADAIIQVIQKYLSDDAKYTADQIAPIVAQGQQILPKLLSTAAAKADVDAASEPSTKESNEHLPLKEATVIENVHDFKARMRLSGGPLPAKELAAFEDFESKL
ncbi:MAG: hypothetical protein M1834_005028 [Cirrosporium novae-zelandiae]|nr:MAG: hypothetical protein M1834_005028 [Cirrosporium novae-zelandiae]